MLRLKSSVCLAFLLSCGLMVACGSETDDAAPADPDFQPEFGTVAPRTEPPAPPMCAEAVGSYTATREPSNVLFLYDRSGSMHIRLPSKQTRWEATKDAFFELLGTLPATTGAGLMLFPQGDAPVNAYCGIDPRVNDVSCKAGWPEPGETARCNPATYRATVPSATLTPEQVQAMKDAVTASDTSFYWGTPLATALTAAIAAQRASTLPGAKSVILLTDGNPTSCGRSGISNDIEHVVEAAAAGLVGKDIVRTFVIGLTDSNRQAARAENLSPIAVAGGTKRTPDCEKDDSCFYKLTDDNFAEDLKKVFEEISLQAFDCTFNLPLATDGADPALVNVQLTDASGTTTTVARDITRTNGWDFLPNRTQIQLYGQACTDMKDAAARLRIVLGCPTVSVTPLPQEPVIKHTGP